MSKKIITDKYPGPGTYPQPASTGLSREQGGPTSPINGTRRPYTPPRLLSSELLELAAGICDGSSGPGKAWPQCNTNVYPLGS